MLGGASAGLVCLALFERHGVVYAETVRQKIFLETIWNTDVVCGDDSVTNRVVKSFKPHKRLGKTNPFTITSINLPSGSITVPPATFSVHWSVAKTERALPGYKCPVEHHQERGGYSVVSKMYAMVDVMVVAYSCGRISVKAIGQHLAGEDEIENVRPCKAVEM